MIARGAVFTYGFGGWLRGQPVSEPRWAIGDDRTVMYQRGPVDALLLRDPKEDGMIKIDKSNPPKDALARCDEATRQLRRAYTRHVWLWGTEVGGQEHELDEDDVERIKISDDRGSKRKKAHGDGGTRKKRRTPEESSPNSSSRR